MSDFTLSDDQNLAMRLLVDELKEGNPLVTLGGYAGSGKSTLIPHIALALGGLSTTAFVCYTGKAALVLRQKLQAAGILEQVGYVGTIHGLIYELVRETKTGEMIWRKRHTLRLFEGDDMGDSDGFFSAPSNDIGRIIIDEVSMVGRKTLKDLQSFGVQILAVGDPAQLPPVQDESVIMDPDVLLTQIHRQAEGNPIIRIATYVREHGTLPPNIQRTGYNQAEEIVAGMKDTDPLNLAILTRSNKARVYFNQAMYGKTPMQGHVVTCLKNDWDKGVCNGQRGIVQSVGTIGSAPWVPMMVNFKDENLVQYFPSVNVPQFGREKKITQDVMEKEFKVATVGSVFDFGIALTVHKAQGSGFNTVLISPESWEWNRNEKADWRCWLYTAVTRATDNLHILPDW